MSAEDDIKKLKDEVKEIKRLHKILDEYASGIGNIVTEHNENRKKDIAKLALDLKTLSTTVAGLKAKK